MIEQINKTILMLKRHGFSFVAINAGEEIFTSSKKGVAPIMELIERNANLKGAAAADKIIGGAAAFLLVKCGVAYVYGDVMSEKAVSILNRYHIPYSYSRLVPFIKNRRGDGLCPMERLCMNVNTPDEAYIIIREFILRASMQT